MPHTASQTFLRELDKKLWTAADKLQTNLAAAARFRGKDKTEF